LKLSGAHQILVYADNISMLVESMRNTKNGSFNNRYYVCLEGNFEKAVYSLAIMSYEENAGKNSTQIQVIKHLKRCNSSDIWQQP
jgi:hypothetical protein